jgi:alkanesulfonate monooxygenase SsuD/methylene tetrahydromethanopterin reductase-like flavin-dependent oxidoreductase (luciferase family)
MKVGLWQFAPYRFMPADFRASPVVTPPYRALTEPAHMFDSYRWFMDELLFALRAGFDAVAVTEHGQNAYDMMPNPNLPAAALANAIRAEGHDAALIVLGRSLGKTREPHRIAEEYAMLDCLSGGRLIAGLPVGLSYDANINNGIAPVETRDRYYEGHELLIKSWTAEAPFSFNGKYSQYPIVNSWPRPLQQPHPPIWIPGTGSPGTMAWTFERNYGFAYISWTGPDAAQRLFDSFWSMADRHGKPHNPNRVALIQSVVVAETDERAEQEYGRWVEAHFRQLGSVPLHYLGLPGYMDVGTLEGMTRAMLASGNASPMPQDPTFSDLVNMSSVIAGSPATVREQLAAFAERFRIGNLLVTLQMGGMPHELALKNIGLFAEEVLPHLKTVWADDEWEHEWWPTGVPQQSQIVGTVEV